MELAINWRRYPFVRMLIPFVIGISVASYIPIFPLFQSIYPLIGLLFCFVFFHFLRQKLHSAWINGLLISFMFIILGVFSFRVHDPAISTQYFGHFVQRDSNTCIVRVDDVETTDNWFKISGTITKIMSPNSKFHAAKGKILLYISKDSSIIHPGNELIFKSRIDSIPKPKNPFAFDYQQYLSNKSINYQCFVRPGAWLLTKNHYSNLPIIAANFRLKLISILKTYIPAQREYSVGSALLLGYRNDIDQDVNNAYINTGSIHILAVSGLHVGLVSGVVMLLFSFLKSRKFGLRLLKLLIVLCFIWGFVLITGASASVIRAAVMFSFIHAGQLLSRRKYIYNSIAASVFVIFLWNPHMMFDVGFHLSLAAVLGIISLQPILVKIWNPDNRALKILWNLASICIAAQISTIPLVLYYFHQTSLYFLISGIFVVPIASIAIYAGIALFVSVSILPILSKFFGMVMYYALFVMNASIFGVQKLPFNLVKDIPFGLLEMILLSFCVLFLIIAFHLKRKYLFITSLCFFLAFVISRISIDYYYSNQSRIIFYASNESVFVDYMQGNNCVSLRQNDDLMQEKYTASGARMHYRIKHSNTVLATNSMLSFYDAASGLMSVPGYRLKIFSKNIHDFYGIGHGTDVYVSDNVNVEKQGSETFKGKAFLGASLNYKCRKQWKDFCLENKIDCIDLKNQSFLINL